jgi:ankyrin repeat protein
MDIFEQIIKHNEYYENEAAEIVDRRAFAPDHNWKRILELLLIYRSNQTPRWFYASVYFKNTAAVAFLMKNGVAPNYNSLYLAISNNSYDIIDLLKDLVPIKLEDIAKNNMDRTPLRYAFMRRTAPIKMLKTLLKYGADTASALDSVNATDETSLLILQNGANPKNEELFIKTEYVQIAKLLLEGGTDPDCLDENGESKLHTTKSIEMTELLLNNGANPNLRTTQTGNTPLHMCCSTQKAKLLLSYGADKTKKNNDRMYAEHYIRKIAEEKEKLFENENEREKFEKIADYIKECPSDSDNIE